MIRDFIYPDDVDRYIELWNALTTREDDCAYGWPVMVAERLRPRMGTKTMAVYVDDSNVVRGFFNYEISGDTVLGRGLVIDGTLDDSVRREIFDRLVQYVIKLPAASGCTRVVAKYTASATFFAERLENRYGVLGETQTVAGHEVRDATVNIPAAISFLDALYP